MTKKHVNSFANRYLDQVIEQLKLPSDYACANALGVTPQAISKVRAGGLIGAATAAKIAHILGLDPMKVIAETEIERGSEDPFWQRIRNAAVVASIGLGVLAIVQAMVMAWHGGDLTVIGIAFFPLALAQGAPGIHIVFVLGLGQLLVTAGLVLALTGRYSRPDKG